MKSNLPARVIEMGKNIVRMTTQAGSGHPSSALSLAHIVATLMYQEMRYDPADPWHPGNDRLVLSEGHAVPVIYAAYADLGGTVGRTREQQRSLTLDDLKTLREWDSVLDGHPNPAEGFPFFDAATGSLGQGLSAGAGLGIAARLNKLNKRIFVLIGDGEAREGQIWEALDFIVDQKLNHVCPIFNCNGQGQADYVSPQQSAKVMAEKLKAFGYRVEVIDGHNIAQISRAIKKVGSRGKPLAIVAKTEKGWGVKNLKAHTNHGKPLPESELPVALASLDKTATRLKISSKNGDVPRPPKPLKAQPRKSAAIKLGPFAEAMARAGMAEAVAKNKLSTRRAYGAALLALGRADERIVALDGDVSNSTFSELFSKAFPKRFMECKIAEQNMISVAVGMAAGGMIPFASSFAKFLSRGYDQIEMAAVTRANINLVGSHAGISLGADGPSQMSLPDLGFFRGYTQADDGRGRPAATLLHPADAVAAYRLTELAANTSNICYLRTHRPDVGLIYKPDATFSLRGCSQLIEGKGLTVVSSGYMVSLSLKAVRELEASRASCSLFDAYTLPMDCEPILEAARRGNGQILVVEDNFVGGFYSAIAEAAAQAGDVRVAGMTCPRVPKSGKSGDIILNHLGLGPAHIAARIKELGA